MNVSKEFAEVYGLIHQSREKAFHAVNKALIELYMSLGEYISTRVENEGWGKGVIDSLAAYIKEQDASLKGFSSRNMWRMKQLYETYSVSPILSPLVTELSWTNNLVILSRTKDDLEREYYIRLAIAQNLSKRALERVIDAGDFERMNLIEQKLSPVVAELHPQLSSHFRDLYVLDFLNLPENYSEKDLQKGILANLKFFILELGGDFTFIGEEYRLQVGHTDFFIDLLFYHRELKCLVAFELKVTKFHPEYVGKMNFYLEVLDREYRKKHENPSVGVILCRDKDDEVVEYTLNRNMSPTLVAEYETKLIPKGKLQAKLREMFHQASNTKEDPS